MICWNTVWLHTDPSHFSDRKRKIEILVTAWAEEVGLLDDDTCGSSLPSFSLFSLTEEQREEEMAKARARITKEQAAKDPAKDRTGSNTHQRAFVKEQEAAAWATALGIKEEEYNEGDAFDERLQLQKKQEKMKQRLEEEKKRLKVSYIFIRSNSRRRRQGNYDELKRRREKRSVMKSARRGWRNVQRNSNSYNNE